MEKNTITLPEKNEYLLKDSMTSFLIPFRLREAINILSHKLSIWERDKMRVDKEAIYEHIQKFLVGNISTKDQESINPHNCLVYSLKDKWPEPDADNKQIAKVLNKLNLEIDAKGQDEMKTLQFSFIREKGSLSSPKLILYPQAQIGLLVLSIALKGQSVADLIALNYTLHKIGLGQSPKIRIAEDSNKPQKEEIKERIKKERDDVYLTLNKYNTFASSQEDIEGWNMNSLIAFLLSDFDKNGISISLFNNTRMHPVTFFSLDSPTCNEDIIRNYIRIIRCQSGKYQVLSEEQVSGKLYMQTFENIFIGASVEGVAVMTLSPENAIQFIKDFKNGIFLTRYLWIYLLAFIQRQTLLKLTEELMDIDMNASYDSKNSLGKIVSRLAKMKINTYFTNISDHTQHNTFYRFCSNNLSIREHLNEVDEKIEDLNIMLQEQIDGAEKERSERLERRIALIAIIQVFFACITVSLIDSDISVIASCYRIPLGVAFAIGISAALWFGLQRKKVK